MQSRRQITNENTDTDADMHTWNTKKDSFAIPSKFRTQIPVDGKRLTSLMGEAGASFGELMVLMVVKYGMRRRLESFTMVVRSSSDVKSHVKREASTYLRILSCIFEKIRRSVWYSHHTDVTTHLTDVGWFWMSNRTTADTSTSNQEMTR
jgi:hypothetical protein